MITPAFCRLLSGRSNEIIVGSKRKNMIINVTFQLVEDFLI